jgi:hypothetical protein
LSDREILSYCLALVAQKVSREPVSRWTDGVFIGLSEQIQKETGIHISRSTLKRLYNKMKTSEEYHPQKETKNALAAFVGFGNWAQFKQDFSPPAKASPEGQSQFTPQSPGRSDGLLKNQIRFFGILGFLAVFLGFAWWFSARYFPSRIDSEPVWGRLEISNPSDTVPFTLNCRFSHAPAQADSFFVGKEQVEKTATTFNMGVIEPGFRWMSLYFKSQTLASQPYHAISRRWMAYYQPKNKKNKMPLLQNEFMHNGIAALRPVFFQGKNLDTLNFNFHLLHSRNYGVSLDNLVFETRVFLPNREGTCTGMDVKLTGDSAQMEYSAYTPGCGNHAYVFLPGTYVSGKHVNLSTLKIQGNSWFTVRLETDKNHLILRYNGKEVFVNKYPKSSGLLKAISLRFNCFAKVEYVRVFDKTGKLVFNEPFGKDSTLGEEQKVQAFSNP